MDFALEVVPVPVTDVDRAKAFYTEQVGFVADHDFEVEGLMRIVQLTPPGSACSIMIGSRADMPPGVLRGLQLVVDDVDAARAELAGRGVDVSPVRRFENGGWVDGRGEDWNSWVFFADPDGNEWVVQERPAPRSDAT